MRNPSYRSQVLLALVLAVVATAAAPPTSAQDAGCSAVLAPSDDVSAAVAAAPAGAVLCLTAGGHRPLSVTPEVRAGITLRGRDGAVVEAADGPAVVVDGATRLTLEGLTVRGGVMARRAQAFALAGVRVDGGEVGVDLGEGSSARLDGVAIERSALAGVVARNATVVATRLTIRDPGGYGVAALGDGAEVALRDSALADGAVSAVFAGAPGCAELPVATAAIPVCFYDDLDAAIAGARLSASGTTIEPGAGTGVLAFPGATVTLEATTVRGRERGGLRAWGATLTVSNSTIEENAVAGIDVRAYPDPRGEALLRGRVELRRTTVRGTRPLGGPILGDGVVIRGADFSLRTVSIEDNYGAGIVISHGAGGDLRDSDVRNNGGPGLCLAAGALMAEGGNLIADNARTSADCSHDEPLE